MKDLTPISPTKSELKDLYGVSASHLRYLMNVRYYEELLSVGYVKTDSIVPPKVLRKFFELHDKPVLKNELFDNEI